MTRDDLADHFDALLRHKGRYGVAELTALLLARVDEYTATPDDAALATWIENNPKAFEAWVRKQDRITGGRLTAPVRRRTRHADDH